MGRSDDQLELQIEELEQHQTEHAAAAPSMPAAPAERVHPIRKPLPGHLPREDEELAPPYAACPGCGGALRCIGEDVLEVLEVVPAQRMTDLAPLAWLPSAVAACAAPRQRWAASAGCQFATLRMTSGLSTRPHGRGDAARN
ncbi:IS66 family transposase zinc-finger binding domain-containing protein [Azospirillum picis]|uniref:IS66 family transposase n=1 Tax=Azospirillum picis TaxID=488438 RepID=UPI0035225923